MNTTIADLAVEGLNVVSARGIVRVRDGQDTWLCRGAAWDAALAELDQQPGDATDDTAGMLAYDALCRAVDGPIASLNGTSRGDYAALVREAVAAELLDEDDAQRFVAAPAAADESDEDRSGAAERLRGRIRQPTR